MKKLFSLTLAALLSLGVLLSFPHSAQNEADANYGNMLPDGIMLLDGKFPDGAGDIQ